MTWRELFWITTWIPECHASTLWRGQDTFLCVRTLIFPASDTHAGEALPGTPERLFSRARGFTTALARLRQLSQ
jgi:hypothetical protein